MVTAVESSELRRDLPQMLARVRAGDRFVITEAGEAVTELVPVTSLVDVAGQASNAHQQDIQRLIAEMKAARDRRPAVSWQEMREWVNEGRR